MSIEAHYSRLILVRHGESLWNQENRFTGWIDVPLTKKGEEEAVLAATKLRGYNIHVAYTSALTRAQRSLELMLNLLGPSVPMIKDQALNERHYGDLQGMNKDEARRQFGVEQVKLWRRSYDISPPNGESLKGTAARTLPFFERCIMGDLKLGKTVLVVAHGNSNRSIVMKLDQLSEKEVLELELATGLPLIYDFDPEGKVLLKQILS